IGADIVRFNIFKHPVKKVNGNRARQVNMIHSFRNIAEEFRNQLYIFGVDEMIPVIESANRIRTQWKPFNRIIVNVSRHILVKAIVKEQHEIESCAEAHFEDGQMIGIQKAFAQSVLFKKYMPAFSYSAIGIMVTLIKLRGIDRMRAVARFDELAVVSAGLLVLGSIGSPGNRSTFHRIEPTLLLICGLMPAE